MKKNMSQADRILRILSFVLSVALFATGTVSMAIGIIRILSGLWNLRNF